ncbi:MAG: hypothetical protein DWQ47_02040 [Acidobacteria bacterium]|nr:MAG: hypothetical protein DWQ32_05590 [Acidobacteriota bacterium]REK01203.1 MAG: hypothetical protein DWQ38_02025 [Acidobacteriota bacterium]REK14159.1 MAG: hypothetical protein DWQ43_11280 [Acidobacteriota bacterium]REK44874.1 MAG: hypothetical protein DWQ47_02040 [Acidobacteriota bacterium]
MSVAPGRRRLIQHFLTGIFALVLVLTLQLETFSQRSDHLTTEEIELVRDTQAVDDRMEVFVRAIERRLISISGTSGLSEEQQEQLRKEENKWGPLPEGDREQLVSDIFKILDEAVSKIDDVADRNAESKLFPFAVHILADYSRELIPILESLASSSGSTRERAFLTSSVNLCRDIVEASSKIDKPDPKERKKAKKG